jgi:hypothetical protein
LVTAPHVIMSAFVFFPHIIAYMLGVRAQLRSSPFPGPCLASLYDIVLKQVHRSGGRGRDPSRGHFAWFVTAASACMHSWFSQYLGCAGKMTVICRRACRRSALLICAVHNFLVSARVKSFTHLWPRYFRILFLWSGKVSIERAECMLRVQETAYLKRWFQRLIFTDPRHWFYSVIRQLWKMKNPRRKICKMR